MLPFFTRNLIIANVVGYLLQSALGIDAIGWFALWTGDPGALVIAPWTLISYSFLHGSLFHLLFNMFAVWMFGADLERVWGARRTALAYFSGVVFGALAQVVMGQWLALGQVPVVGASAGVFALLLGFAIVYPNRTVVLLIPPVPLPARVFVAAYAGLELVLGVTGSQAGVAHFAHLGGLLGGWIAWRYGKSMSNRPPRW